MSGQEQPGLDPGEVKTFTSRKLEWMDGVSIDPDLAPHDFQVGFIIAQCISIEKGIGTIADATIAQRTGTRREHVVKSRKKLRERGWLDWTYTRTTNIYWLKFGLVERMIDLRITYREQRDEARIARLPSRRGVKSSAQHAAPVVRSSAHHNDDAVRSTSQHVVNSNAQHVVRSSAHIHPQCSTSDIHPKKEGLSKKETSVAEGSGPEQEIATATSFEKTTVPIAAEQPLPTPLSEALAEMRLFDALGEGDSDRGCRIAIAIGDARFNYLRRELMGGTLYPSAIRAATCGMREGAA
jgi:hypothetical protein